MDECKPLVLGLIVEAVQAKMNALREGRSSVIEKDHTVGWCMLTLVDPGLASG